MSNSTTTAIMKIKEIYHEKDKEKAEPVYEEISSPLLRKHERLFSRLFEKNKNDKSFIELEPVQIDTEPPKTEKTTELISNRVENQPEPEAN